MIWAMHRVMERLGATTRRWRVDRLATVIRPGTADVQASFVPVAKHYSVSVDTCPPRRGNRKGSVEKSIHYLTQRWWRTARVTTMAEAQVSLDRFCARVADMRRRPPGRFGPEVLAQAGATGGTGPIVGLLATLEDLAPLPVPFPATVEQTVTVGPSALARFERNAYSSPPAFSGPPWCAGGGWDRPPGDRTTAG